jgi:hypothetical protein
LKNEYIGFQELSLYPIVFALKSPYFEELFLPYLDHKFFSMSQYYSKGFKFWLFSSLTCNQIWLSPSFVDDCHFTYLTKLHKITPLVHPPLIYYTILDPLSTYFVCKLGFWARLLALHTKARIYCVLDSS